MLPELNSHPSQVMTQVSQLVLSHPQDSDWLVLPNAANERQPWDFCYVFWESGAPFPLNWEVGVNSCCKVLMEQTMEPRDREGSCNLRS